MPVTNLLATPAARTAAKPIVTADKVKKPLPFATGKGAAARVEAFGDVAVRAYIYGQSRADMVATLRAALGKTPTSEQLARARNEYLIGRVAFALAKDGKAVAVNLASARDVVERMAAPAKDGVKANKLRKGQIARRSPEQHKAVRLAEGAWSLLKAEVAPEQSKAQTLTAKNAKAAGRAPAMAGSTARGNASAAPTHTELVKGDGPMSADKVNAYLSGMAATLLAFANKNAAHVMGGRGEAIKAFHAAIAAADKATRDA